MNIPKGWKLVPVEPTREMVLGGEAEIDRHDFMRLDHAYRAMLAAAPTPPVQQNAEALEVLRELVEARDAYNASETTPQLRDNSTRLRAAGKAARALLEKRGEK